MRRSPGSSLQRMNKRLTFQGNGAYVRSSPVSLKYGGGNKTPVLSLIDTATGVVPVQDRVPDVTGATLRKAIAEPVNMSASTLVTDEWSKVPEGRSSACTLR